MSPLFLIDGYNLMHAVGLAQASYGPGDLQRCRQRLLNLLAGGLSEQQRARTLIVFDAKDPSIPDSLPSQQHGMLVRFAEGSGDADEIIEGVIAAHSAPRRLCVVSADRRLQRAARRRRAQFLDGLTFLREMIRERRRAELPQEPPAKREGTVNPAETDYWLREFAHVDARQLQQEIADPLPPVETLPAGAPPSPDAAAPPAQDSSAEEDFESELAFWERRVEQLLSPEPASDD